MSKFINVVTACIIALALGAPSIAVAEADAGLKGISKKVSYSDLNLDREEGAAVLYQRLKSAARHVCSTRTLVLRGSLHEAKERQACYRDTLDAAVSQVNNQHVNKIHAG